MNATIETKTLEPGSLHPVVRQGDLIQIGTKLTSGKMWWGTVQTVLRINDGRPMYRPKWAKVDKIADHWRLPNDRDQRPGP